MKSVPSENILQLRKLTEEICNTDKSDSEYKKIVRELKYLVETGVEDIKSSKTTKTKIKCYENMCATITNILSNIKII